MLFAVLKSVDYDSAIIFCRTKHGADRIGNQLKRENHAVAILHSDRTQRDRELQHGLVVLAPPRPGQPLAVAEDRGHLCHIAPPQRIEQEGQISGLLEPVLFQLGPRHHLRAVRAALQISNAVGLVDLQVGGEDRLAAVFAFGKNGWHGRYRGTGWCGRAHRVLWWLPARPGAVGRDLTAAAYAKCR